MEEIKGFLNSHFAQIIAVIVLCIVVVLVKFLVRKLIRKFGGQELKSEGRIQQINRVFAIVMNVAWVVGIAIICGVKPQNIITVLASVFAFIGVALFAQWSVLSHITAGIVIFFSMPFKVGDRIEIMDKELPIVAAVENIFTFVIHLRTDDGNLVVLGNSLFLQKTIKVIDGKPKYE